MKFPIVTKPSSYLWILYNNEYFAAYVKVNDIPLIIDIPSCLLSIIQGVCLEDDDGTIRFICIPQRKNKICVHIGKEKSVSYVSHECLFREYHTFLPPNPHRTIQRYRFAYQSIFPQALHGGLHGRALCILEYLEFKEKINVRTPLGQILITCEDTKHHHQGKTDDMYVLVCYGQKTNKSTVVSCNTSSWGKTLLDRIHAVLCISEDLEDRWRGYHWIPKSAILKQKIIPMMGIFPGKSSFGCRTIFDDSVHLWSDDYFVAF